MRGFEHAGLFFVLAINRHQHRLDGRDLGRQHQPLVVGVAHDQAADQARADAPTGLPDVIELAFLGLELHVEGVAEILAEIVAGAGLQREAVLHHGFDGDSCGRRRRIFRRASSRP